MPSPTWTWPILKPLDLIQTARKLTSGRREALLQSDLRRAISTVYYALFHALCENCADALVGKRNRQQEQAAWLAVYRAIDHRGLLKKCSNKVALNDFPDPLKDFADLLAQAQIKRHKADYNPLWTFEFTEVYADIKRAAASMQTFKNAELRSRRAFAIYILFEKRGG